MGEPLEIDPALFGVPALERPVYDGLRAGARGPEKDAAGRWLPADAGGAAAGVLLEVKSEPAAPADELSAMLAMMTRELREQLQAFQALRLSAEGAAAASEDGSGRKQQQADAKAAIEAMSLIVRTLEKIDSLQRSLAHERDRRAEEDIDEAGYAALVKQFEDRIEAKANARAKRLFETWKCEHEAAPLVDAEGTGPPG